MTSEQLSQLLSLVGPLLGALVVFLVKQVHGKIREIGVDVKVCVATFQQHQGVLSNHGKEIEELKSDMKVNRASISLLQSENGLQKMQVDALKEEQLVLRQARHEQANLLTALKLQVERAERDERAVDR